MNGFDDLIIKGDTEAGKFVAYYVLGETVVAVASMGMDPIVMKCAELMKRGKMVGKKEVNEGVDVLKGGFNDRELMDGVGLSRSFEGVGDDDCMEMRNPFFDVPFCYQKFK
ncbi:hypothetical protein EMPG_17171 [Blastomyces silverae]|uniref:Reductase C-terminal domain-containing protein n=1 Tax=Blastomyces silverae TaxID=2060906 RepID=A0A0H1B8H1_9EURO|nr:hypothetical protein EMPG_17171 [Blastomyces silverae]